MTTTAQFLPTPLRVTLLATEGASPLSTLAVLEVFDMANRVRAAASPPRPPAYELVLAGLDAEVTTTAGARVATRPIADLAPPHTLLVGGGPDLPRRRWEPGQLAAVGRLARSASRVASVCGGAFLLGELGLLDGRRCTTHWVALDRLRSRFPAARVETDALYTQDGPIWTSAGVSAGIDLALELIRVDRGPRLAQAVARALVVFLHRPGGQSQFGAALPLRPGVGDRLRALIAHVAANPAGPADVAALAKRAGMSPRNFARVFLAETGETPAAFVARARVDAAQRALSRSDATIAQVAEDCGFPTEATFRRAFARIAGVSPSDWRARFGAGGYSTNA